MSVCVCMYVINVLNYFFVHLSCIMYLICKQRKKNKIQNRYSCVYYTDYIFILIIEIISNYRRNKSSTPFLRNTCYNVHLCLQKFQVKSLKNTILRGIYRLNAKIQIYYDIWCNYIYQILDIILDLEIEN